MKKIIFATLTIALFSATLYLFNVYFNVRNTVIQEAGASNPPTVVDVKLKLISDGTEGQQAFDVTPNDGLATTDPGDDQNANNALVRAGDTVSYQVQLNAINLDTTDTTAIVVLDRGKWLFLPTVCLTTISVPAVAAAKSSSISSDGRTLTCNTGIIAEGTATLINFVARSDNTPNDTILNASVTATANDAAAKTAPPVQVVITARPSIDLVKYVDSYLSGASTIYEPAYIRDQCNTAGVLTPAAPGAICATGVYGDVIIYKFKFQHSRLGDEQLTSPFDVTLDDTFNYGTGNLGTMNATLLSCGVVSGYSASSGSISCGAPSTAGLSMSTVVTLTGLDDAQTGTDGIIGNYFMKYFVPRTDFVVTPVVASMNTSNIITARSSSGAAANEAGWDPNSVTGVSNYGTGATEKSSTCLTDPGSGAENAVTCNNRVALTLNNIPPGSFCADKIDTQISSICATGLKASQNMNVVPNSIVTDVHMGFGSAVISSNSGKMCSVITTDSAGNALYNFTGNLGESSLPGFYGTWQQRSKNFGISFNDPAQTYSAWVSKNDDGSITTSYYNPTVTGDTAYHSFSDFPTALSAQLQNEYMQTLNSVVIEFSTDTVPPNSTNAIECDTGTWKTYSGDGSIQAQVGTTPITKIRTYVKNFTTQIDTLYYQFIVFPEIKITGNTAVLAANGNVVQNYAAVKAFNDAGYQVDTTSGVGQNGPNGWTISNGGVFSTPGEQTTFKGVLLQDLMTVKPGIIRISKSNDRPIAKPGDIVNYTLTPTYLGGGSSTLTVTDTLPAGLTFVSGSFPSICNAAGQVLTCTYANATAGATLSPAIITYKAIVSPNVTNGDFANFVEISSSSAQVNTDSYCTTAAAETAGINQCQAASVVQVRTPGAYYIEKRITSPLVDEVNQELKYNLAIKNVGTVPLGTQEYIEVFPFNGDSGNYTNRVLNPDPSNFNGTVEFKSIVLPAGVTVIAYTTDAPNTIKLDPKCKSNTSAANWIDGTPTISSTNQQGTDWVNYCGGTDTVTNWTLGSTPPANATAIKFASDALLSNSVPPIISIVLQTKNNRDGDRYTNNWSGRSISIDLPIVSNDVSSVVIDGSIGDRVWNDINKDGVQDAGEPGFSNVPITAVWYGVDGILGNTDDMTFNTTTTTDGIYNFNYLASGKYDVTVTTPPVGYIQTFDLDGIATSHKANTITLTKTLDASGNVTSVQDRVDVDFGYAGYKIDGTVWYDVNEDTLNPAVIPACAAVGSPMAQTECGIPAENLKLLDSLGNPVLDFTGAPRTATTNSLGYYEFNNLPIGTYTVVETQPTGFGSSTPNTKAVTIVDQDIHDIDFGETTAMLDGCVYVDADDDGVKDAGELPIGSVAIALTGSDIRGTVVNIPQNTDAVNGCYSYLGLLEGNYTVTETQPAIYDDGKDTAGSTGGQTTTNDVITQIPLISAGESLQNNFGELYKGRISGCVYADYDVSDVYNNPPDLVIPAVTIELQSSAGVTIRSQTTDALGCYDFKNLPDATYQVKETQPTSYLNGKNFINTPAVVDGTDDLISNIIITANHDPKNDFSEYPISGLCGIVYHDRNRSATQMPDANEEGLQNWTLTLTGAQVLVPTTTTTDIQGRYCFPNLAPGSYTVTETQNTLYASSYNNDQVEVVAVPSTPVNNVNFGEYLGTIACKVYYDKDKSMVFGGADTAMSGEEIKLVDQATGLVVGTQFTDASGNCMFRDVPAGTYKLIETQPLGYSSTQNQSNQITVILLPGGDSINNNFGEGLASLSGHVYSDEDIDLIFEHAGPDIAIPAVTINLSCTTVKGDIVTKTTTTNALGYFEFKDLLAGKCSVVETQPTAYADEVEFVGSVGGTLGADEITNITLLAGEDGIHYDFLEIYKEDIKGCSYYDENNDGVMDAAETGIAGVTVKLKNAAGVEIGTTTTMADGCYEFLDIPLGTYTVVETPPDGYGSSTPDTIEVILRRDTGLDKDFGDTKSSSIACMVFDDTDNDGVKDEAEVGVANVTVKLTGKDGLNADVNMSVTTDNSGNCIFSGLNAGEYDLVFTQPDGYIMGIKTVGTKGGDIVQTGFENIKVLGLENVTGYNYAVRGGVLKVCTMYDKNKSGVIESDEVGVSGQLVELRKANGDLVTTLTTGADGCVTKYGIVLGDYKVKAVNSKYLIIGEATLGISFNSEKLVENVTYGLQDGGVLMGCIYNDMNKNKTKDTGEGGISEVKVTVTMGADTKSTMTDTNGCYTLNTGFGEYTLKVEPKPGYELTSKGEVKGVIEEKMKEVKADFGMVKGLAVTGNYYMIYMLLGILLVVGVGVKRKVSTN